MKIECIFYFTHQLLAVSLQRFKGIQGRRNLSPNMEGLTRGLTSDLLLGGGGEATGDALLLGSLYFSEKLKGGGHFFEKQFFCCDLYLLR